MYYSWLLMVFVQLFVVVFFERVLVYLDHKHHHHHPHQDVQLLNFQYLDHVEMMSPIFDIVVMEYIQLKYSFQLLFHLLINHLLNLH
jgi:hypothetical protein